MREARRGERTYQGKSDEVRGKWQWSIIESEEFPFFSGIKMRKIFLYMLVEANRGALIVASAGPSISVAFACWGRCVFPHILSGPRVYTPHTVVN